MAPSPRSCVFSRFECRGRVSTSCCMGSRRLAAFSLGCVCMCPLVNPVSFVAVGRCRLEWRVMTSTWTEEVSCIRHSDDLGGRAANTLPVLALLTELLIWQYFLSQEHWRSVVSDLQRVSKMAISQNFSFKVTNFFLFGWLFWYSLIVWEFGLAM